MVQHFGMLQAGYHLQSPVSNLLCINKRHGRVGVANLARTTQHHPLPATGTADMQLPSKAKKR
jgi:hypothetical protein